MKDLGKGPTLVIGGLGFIYFAWLYSATGIFTTRRGSVAILQAEDPDRFASSVGIVVALGTASLVAGVVMMLLRRRED